MYAFLFLFFFPGNDFIFNTLLPYRVDYTLSIINADPLFHPFSLIYHQEWGFGRGQINLTAFQGFSNPVKPSQENMELTSQSGKLFHPVTGELKSKFHRVFG